MKGEKKNGFKGLTKEVPITFKNERGKNLSAVIHLPDEAKPPAVVICHGFQSTKTKRKPVRLWLIE